MKNQHTPGPWNIIPNAIIGHWQIESPSGRIATVSQCINGTEFPDIDTQAKANAQLIAAAPDLLECCQELLKMVDELLPLAQHGCGWGTIATDQARAAIAKAIGQ